MSKASVFEAVLFVMVITGLLLLLIVTKSSAAPSQSLSRQFDGNVVIPGSPYDVSGAVDWVQTTISIPASIQWTQPNQQASAWVMAVGPVNRLLWAQMGWLWQEGRSRPILYAESGSMFWFGSSLTGSSVTVALSCDFSTDVFHNWLLTSAGWKLMHTQYSGMGCNTQLQWDRYIETDTPVGTAPPVFSSSVSFTNTEADVLGNATLWPDAVELVP